MAPSSSLAALLLLRRLLNRRSSFQPPPPFSLTNNHRLFSSSSEAPAIEDDPPSTPSDDLRTRIFRLRFPKRSATAALDNWVDEGHKVTAPELRQIAKDLKRSQRYKHALEISEWMKTHQELELSDTDYALRIDLITKVFGVNAAEEFFNGLPPTAKSSEAYTALLHSYARAKFTDKAENLFERIKKSNLTLTALTYNEIMTLYISVGQPEKVSLVIEELKRQKVSPDLFTYNLWISASAAALDIDRVRGILDEMSRHPCSDQGWITYMQLADIYIKANLLVSSENSLVEAEEKISQREWITYDFLIMLHAGLGNRERITEVWKALRMASQKMTSRSYVCVLSSYLVLGQLKEAGDVIDEWKQSKTLDFDILACERLLDAFVKAGLVERADRFRELMLQKNCEFS